MVPASVEKFRIFRTIFWVSIRYNQEIAGSTAPGAQLIIYNMQHSTPAEGTGQGRGAEGMHTSALHPGGIVLSGTQTIFLTDPE